METLVSRIRAVPSARWVHRLETVAREGNEQEVKQLTILACAAIGPAQLSIWAGLYLYFGHAVSGLTMLAYAAATLACVAACCVNFDYARLCNHVVLALIFLVNLGISFHEGGIIASNGQFLWAFLAPMGMLIISTRLVASLWMLAYSSAVIALAAMAAVSSEPPLPTWSDRLLWAMNVIAVASFVFYAMSYYVAKKDSFYALLKEEEAKSESLLLNVLPSEIAAELKAGRGRAAHKIDEATIVFLDLVGFTQIGAGKTPMRPSQC